MRQIPEYSVVYSRLQDCSILDIPLLIIEKFEGTPILTPGDLTYKRTSECRNGAAWKQAAPTSFKPHVGCILARSLAKLPNPLAPIRSIAEALSLFIDQSG